MFTGKVTYIVQKGMHCFLCLTLEIRSFLSVGWSLIVLFPFIYEVADSGHWVFESADWETEWEHSGDKN